METENDHTPNIGLGSIRKNKTSSPKKIEPNRTIKQRRSLPSDQILIRPTRRLNKKDTPKSVQMQIDTHVAIKMIGVVENKRMYEVLNEITEEYVKHMPESSKKLIIDNVRMAQENMDL